MHFDLHFAGRNKIVSTKDFYQIWSARKYNPNLKSAPNTRISGWTYGNIAAIADRYHSTHLRWGKPKAPGHWSARAEALDGAAKWADSCDGWWGVKSSYWSRNVAARPTDSCEEISFFFSTQLFASRFWPAVRWIQWFKRLIGGLKCRWSTSCTKLSWNAQSHVCVASFLGLCHRLSYWVALKLSAVEISCAVLERGMSTSRGLGFLGHNWYLQHAISSVVLITSLWKKRQEFKISEFNYDGGETLHQKYFWMLGHLRAGLSDSESARRLENLIFLFVFWILENLCITPRLLYGKEYHTMLMEKLRPVDPVLTQFWGFQIVSVWHEAVSPICSSEFEASAKGLKETGSCYGNETWQWEIHQHWWFIAWKCLEHHL